MCLEEFHYTFLCPNETIFDMEQRSCYHWKHVSKCGDKQLNDGKDLETSAGTDIAAYYGAPQKVKVRTVTNRFMNSSKVETAEALENAVKLEMLLVFQRFC